MAEQKSLMDDLAEAWDQSESENVDTEEMEPEVEAVEGEPADEPDGGPESEADEPADADGVPGGEATPDVEAPTPDSDLEKAPPGLQPAAREAWKDTPEAVRKEIQKREKDFEAGIMKYAEGAKRAEMMDRTLQPYQQLFAMNGGPAQVLPGLLQTASLLQMGSPAQKAQTVAQLIQQFGVDIATLDGLLVGEQPKEQGPNIEQLVDQRLQAYQQQQRAYQEQQEMQHISSEIDQFAADPKHEFYNDVKMDMADLLDMAAKRGQSMSLEQAYERACAMNPQISQIMGARTSQQSVNTKRKAAASIKGAPAGSGEVAPDSTRAALEAAWDMAGRT